MERSRKRAYLACGWNVAWRRGEEEEIREAACGRVMAAL